MTGNTGNGYRKGAVKQRTQFFNPHTRLYVKKDDNT